MGGGDIFVSIFFFVPIFFGIGLQGFGRARANRCCLKLGIVVRP
jgi:hypothetical protein